jgi:hypothetical protein
MKALGVAGLGLGALIAVCAIARDPVGLNGDLCLRTTVVLQRSGDGRWKPQFTRRRWKRSTRGHLPTLRSANPNGRPR